MATATIPELWPEKSLYEILGIEKTATAEQVKKAYYKQALKYVSFGGGSVFCLSQRWCLRACFVLEACQNVPVCP